jgi:hypothetical protein
MSPENHIGTRNAQHKLYSMTSTREAVRRLFNVEHDRAGKNRSRNSAGLYLKRMERVKGIEPSYSAWKAAALPLSYTRAGVDLTRRAGGLNPPLAARPNIPGGYPIGRSGPLNRGRFAVYIDVSINNERR